MQPTHEWKASPFFFFFCSGDKTDTKIQGNTEAAVACLENKRARVAFVCICRADTDIIFQAETCKFERGIAEKQKVIVTTHVMYGYRVRAISLDGWRIGH